jgi:hypothetical protein
MPETSENITYIIESNNGAFWEEVNDFRDLEYAVVELVRLRTSLPNVHHRLIKSKWEVLEA